LDILRLFLYAYFRAPVENWQVITWSGSRSGAIRDRPCTVKCGYGETVDAGRPRFPQEAMQGLNGSESQGRTNVANEARRD